MNINKIWRIPLILILATIWFLTFPFWIINEVIHNYFKKYFNIKNNICKQDYHFVEAKEEKNKKRNKNVKT